MCKDEHSRPVVSLSKEGSTSISAGALPQAADLNTMCTINHDVIVNERRANNDYATTGTLWRDKIIINLLAVFISYSLRDPTMTYYVITTVALRHHRISSCVT